jgi:hypothetical protein
MSISLARGVGRVAGVAHPVGALLEVDPGQLDLAADVGLGLADLDLAALEHPAVALVLEVLLVGDEVRELLVEPQDDVDRLREAELLGVDVLDRRVEQHQVVTDPVDRVAGLDLDRQVAAGPGRHA